MDYSPSIPVYEHIVEIAASKARDPLIITVDAAKYDVDARQASIVMGDAFQKSHDIEFHRGKRITLVYKNEAPDLTQCPDVDVPIEDIKRDVDYTGNAVTITISNISQTLADSIAQNLCLFIDANIVKKVANPDFISKEERSRKKKHWFFLND